MQKGSKGGLLSASEREFVEGGVELNVRSDGRERLAYRSLELQVSRVLVEWGYISRQFYHDHGS
jgi:hypothetical protein